MENKRYICIFMLFISVVLIAMPAIPHHHHGNGIICMKDDIKDIDCCSSHHTHHHQEDDPCCNGDCAANFLSSTPILDTEDIQPQFTFIQTLFTESLLRFLTQPVEKDVYNDFVYVESLHGTYLTRAVGLRAPPVS